MRSEVASARRSQLTLLAQVEPDIRAGTTVAQMRALAARDRIDLGVEFLRIADSLLRSGTRKGDAAELRTSIGRSYYAMFQAARAVVFDDFGGDDNNGHQELPKHLPKAFPSRAQRVNDLKDARLTRNDADYGPYPKTAAHWEPIAKDLHLTATAFVTASDNYLKARGI